MPFHLGIVVGKELQCGSFGRIQNGQDSHLGVSYETRPWQVTKQEFREKKSLQMRTDKVFFE